MTGERRAGLLSLLAVVFCLACPAAAKAEEGDMALREKEIHRRALVSMGDVARLQRVMAKARRGEKVVVSVIGGSITAGARASRVDARWGNLVHRWWRETFTDADVRFVNAGIGATGSSIGAHRAKEHLLVHSPDFVAIEFSVNDPNEKLFAETLEGLVRQILNQPNRPAAMLLFTMHRNGGNAQERHSKIGRHYGLPMVSFRDALWPEIEAGRMKWEDVEADEVHPNDRGHRYCADFIIDVLRKVHAELPADAGLPQVPVMPPASISDVFEHTAMLNAESGVGERAQGWKRGEGRAFGPSWEADKPGDFIEFEIEATAISVVFYRIKGDMGMALAQVDDLPPVKLDGWFQADWGGYSHWQLVARDLKPGKHRLRIEILEEKAPRSGGHNFQLHAVMIAGGDPAGCVR